MLTRGALKDMGKWKSDFSEDEYIEDTFDVAMFEDNVCTDNSLRFVEGNSYTNSIQLLNGNADNRPEYLA